MRVLIIEDEQHAVKLLTEALKRLRPDAVVITDLDSVMSALNWFHEAKETPDLVFMDIELADGNSFEIFKHTKVDCPVIFTTAYNKYALSAFEVNALDYILKPIDLDRLSQAIDRWEKSDRQTLAELHRRVDAMTSEFKQPKKQRCLVKHGGVFEFVNVDQIALAYSEDSVTFLLTKDGKRHIYGRTIEELIAELDERLFFQANRAVIVQIENVKKVHPYLGQRLKLELDHQGTLSEVLVSRQRGTEFKLWLDS